MTDIVANNAKFARQAWLRALERTASINRDPSMTLPALMSGLGQRFGDAPALESPEATLSYAQLSADRRFLGMSMAYLAGSAFLEWLEKTHGQQSSRDLWASAVPIDASRQAP